LFFLLIGIAGYVLVWDLPMGRAVRMGPGYIPKVLSCILIGFGLIIGGRSFFVKPDHVEPWHLRPLVVISVSILFFAFLIDSTGLVLASIALMLVSTVGGRELNWRETTAFAVLLTYSSVIVFHLLLGLPMQVWPI